MNVRGPSEGGSDATGQDASAVGGEAEPRAGREAELASPGFSDELTGSIGHPDRSSRTDATTRRRGYGYHRPVFRPTEKL